MEEEAADLPAATRRKAIAYALAPLILSGCGGGGSSDPAPAPAPPPPAAPPPAPAPPSISTQPADTSATAGAPVVFSVALGNDSGASYQWLRNGVEIAGATQASLRIAPVSLLDSGATFSVRVANAAGSATSQGARLSVASTAFTLLAGTGGQAGAALGDVDGFASSARFTSTSPMAVDNEGNIYVVTYGAIRKVTPAGAVTAFVGQYGQPGRRDGSGSAARIAGPSGLLFDSARNVLVLLDASAGTSDATCDPAFALFCPTATAYVRELTLSGTVTTTLPLSGPAALAGLVSAPGAGFCTAGGNAYDTEAPALNFYPRAPTAVYRIAGPGAVVLVAGNPDVRGYKDGSAASALFSRIAGIAADAAGNLYIADGKRVRKLSRDGVVSTVAGNPAVAGARDGPGTAASFSSINSIAMDPAGNVLVADANLIRRVTPDGNVTTVAQVTSPDSYSLLALALGPGGAVDVGGFSYVGRFEAFPG
ncbi:hypothetical protein ACFPOE_05045 [Caenimonas terrae]|uniref:Ig-like domain-containing protein n=1 Tax=Caenimonas terrae TaxID=696074 RepID=A0ABW0NAF0_9BURK